MILLVLASLLWSVSFALIGQSGIHPDLLGAARLGLAAALFAPFLLRARGGADSRRGALMLIGAVQFGLMYVLVMRSYRYLAGHEVALLTITTPILVVLVEAAIARRLYARAVVAAAIAVGAALALRRGALTAALNGSEVDAEFVTGLLLVQGANLAWAVGQIAYRRVAPGGSSAPALNFGWLYVGAFALSAAWASVNVTAADLELTTKQVWTIAYLGLVPSGLAFYLWNRGATRVSVSVLAVMNNLKVPLAVVVALLPPFNEAFDAGPLALSAALFAVALVVASWPAPRAVAPKKGIA